MTASKTSVSERVPMESLSDRPCYVVFVADKKGARAAMEGVCSPEEAAMAVEFLRRRGVPAFARRVVSVIVIDETISEELVRDEMEVRELEMAQAARRVAGVERNKLRSAIKAERRKQLAAAKALKSRGLIGASARRQR